MNAIRSLVVAVVASVVFSPLASRADVDFGFFYDELSPYGNWVDVDDYGYCFQPNVGGSWRPYTDGYWADSDEGWLWVSNEPFGWATYHYGRWANVTGQGWVWVPGYDWGPGWVSWRESNDYVGWAPLPPQVAYRPQTGIRFGVSFGFGDVGPGYYNFIRPRYFGYNGYRDYVLPYDRNVDIIEQTTNITNITNVVNNNRTVIYNNGPNRDFLRAQSERPIRRLNVQREENLTAAQIRDRKLRNQLQGDNYRVVAPKVSRGDASLKPKKVSGKIAKAQLNDGYARISDKKRADEVRNRIRAQADDPKNQKKNVVAARPEDRDDKAKNAGNGKKNADAKRDDILKRQAEFEKKPKNQKDKDREKREVAAQQREARQQLAKNGDKKPGDAGNDSKKSDRPGKADKSQDRPQAAKKSDDSPKKENRPKNADKPVSASKKSDDKPKQQKADKPRKDSDKPKASKPQADRPKATQDDKPKGKSKPDKKSDQPQARKSEKKSSDRQSVAKKETRKSDAKPGKKQSAKQEKDGGKKSQNADNDRKKKNDKKA